MIKSVAIIGAGQMGSGIAYICALASYRVQIIDISQAQLTKAKESIEKTLDRQIAKGIMTKEDKESTLKNIQYFPLIRDPESIDLAIEAVSEELYLKLKTLEGLDTLLPPSSLIASNTSSISITQLGNATSRPDRVIGMHFMNPAPLMPLVEVIRGNETSNATHSAIHKMIGKLGKTPVSSKDTPGFIVNRILMPMINEAIYVLHEGVASPQDIDTAMKLGTNQPMGPLELADFIGLDTCLSVMQTLHRGFGDDKYRPCPLLVEYVTKRRLGKKSGNGFYKY